MKCRRKIFRCKLLFHQGSDLIKSPHLFVPLLSFVPRTGEWQLTSDREQDTGSCSDDFDDTGPPITSLRRAFLYVTEMEK